ncbi:MAG: ThuA domain-containing protein [Planctomycetota bacterium]
MKKAFCPLVLFPCICVVWAGCAKPESGRRVLIIQDERPQIDVLAGFLEDRGGLSCEIVDQKHIPADLSAYEAVIVFIHYRLTRHTERVTLDYCRQGGRWIGLHHTISRVRRSQNKPLMDCLGLALPEGSIEAGGYIWRHDADWYLVNVNPGHYITSNGISWPDEVRYRSSDSPSLEGAFPAVRLIDSEVYLNHTFTDGRAKTILCGIKYADRQTATTLMQDRGAWLKPHGAGYLIYMQPGHAVSDYEHPCIAQMILNAITWDPVP